MRVPLDTMPCKFGTNPRKQVDAFFALLGKPVFGKFVLGKLVLGKLVQAALEHALGVRTRGMINATLHVSTSR
jgi:hypothetical protein